MISQYNEGTISEEQNISSLEIAVGFQLNCWNFINIKVVHMFYVLDGFLPAAFVLSNLTPSNGSLYS